MFDLKKQRLVTAAALVTIVLIFVLLWAFLTPVAQLPPAPGISDYFWHISIFAILVIPLGTTLPSQSLTIALAAILFGTVIEFIQPNFGRGFEIHDLVSNAVGVCAGWWIAKKLAGLLKPRSSQA